MKKTLTQPHPAPGQSRPENRYPMQNPTTRASTATEDASYLLSRLPALPPSSGQPVMIMLSGLPGTGKSYFARRLASRCPVVILESDAIRKDLFSKPTYEPAEHVRTFAVLHSMAEDLLRRSISVLIDATNLIERNRRIFYNIAQRCGAKLIPVQTTAPSQLVRKRLDQRESSGDREGSSDAGWDVYLKLEPSMEPIVGEHYVVDTSEDTQPLMDQVAHEANKWISNSSAKEEVWTSK